MIGEILSNYRVTSQIGAGGMGIVYAGEHVLLGKSAAIKVLKPERCESPEIVERFFNEARAAALVKHPGIPEIFDYGHLPNGNAYLVMEMLEGCTLGSVLKERKRLSAGRALSLTRLIAGTLAATHAVGIIHRDLKPDNVFIVADPAMPRGERIQILDFGIAKLQRADFSSSVQTETGRLMGTPYYMSPEQCRGSGKIDHRTDIYSLGCVLYQMLSGRPPFTMPGSGEVLAAHIHVQPRPVNQVESLIPEGLAQLCMQLLEKDPNDRPQTMEAVISELNRLVSVVDSEEAEPSLAASGDMNIRMLRDTIEDARLRKTTTMNAAESLVDEVETWGGETEEVVKKKSNKRFALWAVVALGLSFGLWGVWVAFGKQKESPESGKVAEIPPVAEPTPKPNPPPLIVREVVEVPAQVEFVSIKLDSEPSNARVYRIADGVEIGRTPLSVQVRKGEGVMRFLLRKSGYKLQRVEIPVASNQEELVVLNKRGEGSGASAKSTNKEGLAVEETKSAEAEKPVEGSPEPVPEPPERGIRTLPSGGRLGEWSE